MDNLASVQDQINRLEQRRTELLCKYNATYTLCPLTDSEHYEAFATIPAMLPRLFDEKRRLLAAEHAAEVAP